MQIVGDRSHAPAQRLERRVQPRIPPQFPFHLRDLQFEQAETLPQLIMQLTRDAAPFFLLRGHPVGRQKRAMAGVRRRAQ